MSPLFLALLLVFFLDGRLRPGALLADGDTGWHIRIGQAILDQGLPRTGLFSWTEADRPWVAHSWLADAAFGALERAGGLPAVVTATALLFAWPFARVTSFLIAAGRPAPLALPLGLLGWASARYTELARPQILTLVLLAEWSIALERGRPGLRLSAGLLASGVLWANLHGGVLAGLLLLLVRAPRWLRGAGARAAPFLLMPAVLLATPHGLSLLPALGQILGAWPRTSHAIEEWGWTWSSPPLPFLALLGGVAFLAFRWRRGLGVAAGSELVLWLLVASWAHRFIPVAVCAALPVLARGARGGLAPSWPRPLAWLSGFLERAAVPRKRLRGTLGGLAVAALLLSPAHPAVARAVGIDDRMDPFRFPVGTAQQVRDAARGRRVFHPYDWGGYLIYAWRGQPGVFIDGRYELYRDGLYEMHLTILAGGERSLALLDRFGVDLVLVPRESALDHSLAATPSWRAAAVDACSRAWLRR